jgi:hypothetical protein
MAAGLFMLRTTSLGALKKKLVNLHALVDAVLYA